MKLGSIALFFVMMLCLAGCSGDQKDPGLNAPEKFGGKVFTSMDEALSAAKADNKPILLVAFQGDPQQIERNLLSDDVIKLRGDKIITAKIDAASGSSALQQYGISQYPTIMLLKPDGVEAWRGAGMVMPGMVAQAIDAEVK